MRSWRGPDVRSSSSLPHATSALWKEPSLFRRTWSQPSGAPVHELQERRPVTCNDPFGAGQRERPVDCHVDSHDAPVLVLVDAGDRDEALESWHHWVVLRRIFGIVVAGRERGNDLIVEAGADHVFAFQARRDLEIRAHRVPEFFDIGNEPPAIVLVGNDDSFVSPEPALMTAVNPRGASPSSPTSIGSKSRLLAGLASSRVVADPVFPQVFIVVDPFGPPRDIGSHPTNRSSQHSGHEQRRQRGD